MKKRKIAGMLAALAKHQDNTMAKRRDELMGAMAAQTKHADDERNKQTTNIMGGIAAGTSKVITTLTGGIAAGANKVITTLTGAMAAQGAMTKSRLDEIDATTKDTNQRVRGIESSLGLNSGVFDAVMIVIGIIVAIVVTIWLGQNWGDMEYIRDDVGNLIRTEFHARALLLRAVVGGAIGGLVATAGMLIRSRFRK